MVSAIIPTLNEEKRIGSIIEYLKNKKVISEIIVIDDGSTDQTYSIAQSAGAKVFLSSMLGKGASMEDGLTRAQNDIVLFLDGDIFNFSFDLVDKMVEPLLDNNADFVKGKFNRAAGRVTALTAKPLLKTFFPELFNYEQPLGGIVAAKRDFLTKIRFENDYGVDIGLLIDVFQLGARIREVEIGYLDHDHQSLESLSKMSFQIVRTILERASKYRKLHPVNIGDSHELERVAGFQYGTLLQKINFEKPLVLFDMDGTLIEGSFIESLSHFIGVRQELNGLIGNYQIDPVYRTEMIAKVLAGTPKYKFEKIAKTIPLKPFAQETIISLRQKGFQVGIITDSYFIASEIIKKRVFADFSVAHLLQFKKGLATGDITISPFMRYENGCEAHRLCKSNFLPHLQAVFSDYTNLQISSVGNGENDICLFKKSQFSYSVFPQSQKVVNSAKVNLNSLREVIDYV